MNRLPGLFRKLARWWVLWLLLGLAAVWALRTVDLAGLPFMPDATWSRVQRQGVLRVATDASYPPLASITPDGAFQGLDVDLARAIGYGLGVQVELVNIHWDGLFGALDAGKVDVVIAAVPYDGTLTRDLAFSAPYADLGLVLVAREGAAFEPTLFGSTVAVELGSEAHLYAKRRSRETEGLTLKVAHTLDELETWLAQGEVDLAICDRVAGGRLAALPGFNLVLPPLVSEPVHIVTERSAGKLTSAVGAVLTDLQESGALQIIVERWVGSAQ